MLVRVVFEYEGGRSSDRLRRLNKVRQQVRCNTYRYRSPTAQSPNGCKDLEAENLPCVGRRCDMTLAKAAQFECTAAVYLSSQFWRVVKTFSTSDGGCDGAISPKGFEGRPTQTSPGRQNAWRVSAYYRQQLGGPTSGKGKVGPDIRYWGRKADVCGVAKKSSPSVSGADASASALRLHFRRSGKLCPA